MNGSATPGTTDYRTIIKGIMGGIQKKVYSQWAFQDDFEQKRDMNTQIYRELMEKHKVLVDCTPHDEEYEKYYDVILKFDGFGYANKKYLIHKNTAGLSMDELALICDGGNLCFGYRTEGKYIVIYTD